MTPNLTTPREALEAAAKICERRAEERFDEYGTTEPDTGASYYGGRCEDEYTARDEEDHDCAAAIRALLPQVAEQKAEAQVLEPVCPQCHFNKQGGWPSYTMSLKFCAEHATPWPRFASPHPPAASVVVPMRVMKMCKRHEGLPYTLTATVNAPAVEYCPICEDRASLSAAPKSERGE